jgi:hypothetical protein
MVKTTGFNGIEVTFNGMASLLNFMKIYQLVQKLFVGHTDGWTAWGSHKLRCSFLRKVGGYIKQNTAVDENWTGWIL